MGTMTSVTILGISLIIIAVAVWLLERKYTKSWLQLKAATDRITVLESTVSTQGNAIASSNTKINVVGSDRSRDRIKIGDLEASKLPLRDYNTPKQETTQNDQAITMLTTAAIVSSYDNTPSSSSGSCGSSSSSDSGGSDSSSSCSSGSDSY